jgi:drug/metabolite transporter (DMT)-like permease
MWLFPASIMMVFETITSIHFSRKSIAHISATQRAFAMTLGCLILAIPYLAYEGIPVIFPRFWVIVSIHAVLLTIARILLMRAYARGALSQILPIMQLQLILLMITNPLLTNDTVSTLGWIGVIVTAIGIYAAQFKKRDGEHATDLLAPFREILKPGMREILMVTVIYSVTSNLDKLAIQASSGAFFLVIIYSFMIFLFLGIIRFRIAPSKEAFRAALRVAAAPKVLVGGLAQGITVIGQVISLTLAPVPFVIAFKQLSIGAGSLWGLFVRKDRRIPWYGLLGILLSVIGAIVMTFSR